MRPTLTVMAEERETASAGTSMSTSSCQSKGASTGTTMVVVSSCQLEGGESNCLIMNASTCKHLSASLKNTTATSKVTITAAKYQIDESNSLMLHLELDALDAYQGHRR